MKEGARDLKRMEVTLKPLVTCCNLHSRRKREYIKSKIVHNDNDNYIIKYT